MEVDGLGRKEETGGSRFEAPAAATERPGHSQGASSPNDVCPPPDEHGSPDEHVGPDRRKQRDYEVPMRAQVDVGIVLPVEDVARPE